MHIMSRRVSKFKIPKIRYIVSMEESTKKKRRKVDDDDDEVKKLNRALHFAVMKICEQEGTILNFKKTNNRDSR